MTDARRALLGRLIDHAALFPPASMSMEDAVAEDRRAREDEHAWMVDRFVCPASRLAELSDACGGWAESPELSVVLDGVVPADEPSWSEALEADAEAVARVLAEGAPVRAIELRLPSPRPGSAALVAAQAALRPLRVEGYLEPTFGALWRNSLPAVIGAAAAIGARFKLRCGGATADDVPSVEQVALVIASCLQAGVVFKATAGLHHPVRQVDEATGLAMHGFLNVLAAAAFAAAHNTRTAELERVLAEEDPGAFEIGPEGLTLGALSVSGIEIAAARQHLFRGYGSCSWREPVEELRELGVLA